MVREGVWVFDPSGVSEVVEVAMAGRPEDLAGKRVGILWNLKPNGDILLARLQERLEATHGLKSVIWKRRPPSSSPLTSANDLGVLKDLVDCDVVLNALAD